MYSRVGQTKERASWERFPRRGPCSKSPGLPHPKIPRCPGRCSELGSACSLPLGVASASSSAHCEPAQPAGREPQPAATPPPPPPPHPHRLLPRCKLREARAPLAVAGGSASQIVEGLQLELSTDDAGEVALDPGSWLLHLQVSHSQQLSGSMDFSLRRPNFTMVMMLEHEHWC